MEQWHDFFVATAGAAATLTGLIFVGVSINLTKILSIPQMPNRALISLIILLQILIVSILFLVPEQPNTILGIEVLGIGLLAAGMVIYIDLNILTSKRNEFRNKYILNMCLSLIALTPYLIAGIAILFSAPSGVYWLIPAFIFSFLKSVLDAWVLLVEINR